MIPFPRNPGSPSTSPPAGFRNWLHGSVVCVIVGVICATCAFILAGFFLFTVTAGGLPDEAINAKVGKPYPDFEALGIEVITISPDTVGETAAMRRRRKIGMRMLSDESTRDAVKECEPVG